MLTDKTQLITFLHSAEGGNRSPAYDDKQPWKELQPGDEILGTLTYGPGFTTREDGSPLQIGDTITEQEAFDRLSQYIDEEIEPVLENLIHVPIAPSMANALASLIFNFGATEVSGWRLWGRINAGEDPGAVIREWVNGTFFSKGEPMLGLWRRRTMELLLGFGLDWRAGSNVSWEDDPEDVMKQLGWDGTMPSAGPVHTPTRTEYKYDEGLFEELEIKKRGEVITDPTPATPLTTKDLNEMQAEHVRTGAPLSYERPVMPVGKKPLSINTKKAEEVPYGIDPKAGLQPKEEAERYRRAVKKEKGIEMKQIGQGLTLTTGVVAGANELSGEAKTFMDTLGTIGLVLLATAFAIGIGYWLVGYAREKWNERKEIEAEINAVQGMY